MCCPRWLFVAPGLVLISFGLLAYALALPAVSVGKVTFDVHTLLYGSLAVLCGYQSVLFAIFTTTFAVNEGIRPATRGYDAFFRWVNLEKGVALGLLACAAGAALMAMTFATWRSADFGRLDYPQTMRFAIPGTSLLAIGFQTILSSFFVSILGMQRR
jgi:hypothetical protein